MCLEEHSHCTFWRQNTVGDTRNRVTGLGRQRRERRERAEDGGDRPEGEGCGGHRTGHGRGRRF